MAGPVRRRRHPAVQTARAGVIALVTTMVIGCIAAFAPASWAAAASARAVATGRTAVAPVRAWTPAASLHVTQPPAAPLPVAQPKAYILVDADSGAVLAAENDHAALPPASTVKIFTALFGLSVLHTDSPITVSATAAAQPAMRIGMRAGEVWTLDQALQALLVVSANDAAYAIAEQAAGGLAAWPEHATAFATRLGLRDSTFRDPAGLDDTPTSGTRMSAFDLAITARDALHIPEIADTSRRLDITLNGPNGVTYHLVNHNKTFLTGYAGAIGLKSGFTDLAGRTLIAAATRNGRTMITVVLGVYSTTSWASALLDQGFATPPGANGTGERLPAVRITSTRSGLRLVGTSAEPAMGSPGAGSSRAPNGAKAETRTRAALDPSTRRTRRATARSGSGLGATIAVLLLASAVLLVFLRRRAGLVRRRRQAPRERLARAQHNAHRIELDLAREERRDLARAEARVRGARSRDTNRAHAPAASRSGDGVGDGDG